MFDYLYLVDFVVVDLVLCYTRFILGLLFIVLSLGFNFDFFSSSQEISWEERPRYDLFSVE